jgi:beta-hydroxyacyl-ACP dehydratase FabZ
MKNNVSEILKVLPHKYPFLMVDKVISKTDTNIVTLKNVSHNEPYFSGHFPNFPIMPGVLILEGMFQSGGLLFGCADLVEGQLAYVTTIDKVKFIKPALPGDQIKFDINITTNLSKYAKFSGKAYVDNVLITQATWTSVIINNTKE